jgi:predicted protein tyrosine phosphatase
MTIREVFAAIPDELASTAARVDDAVVIGGYRAAADAALVRLTGARRIVKMFADSPAYPGGAHRHPGVEYLVVAAEDTPSFDIREGAFAAVRFIRDAMRAGETTFVHCHAGVSRSATVVLLHLMVNRGLTLDAAMARLRQVRPVVNPNPGFMACLAEADARLRRGRAAAAAASAAGRAVAV